MKKITNFLNKAKRNKYIIRLVIKDEKAYIMSYRNNSFRLVDCLVSDLTDTLEEYIDVYTKENKIVLKVG